MDSAFLAADDFKFIVASTPLISIDLVVRNSQGLILLGERTNRPAQGFWFVPGGRVLKNETLADAFLRLTRDELGIEIPIAQARYLGLYEHFYDDSVFGDSPSTHYVVNAFEVTLCTSDNNVKREVDGNLPDKQHSRYQWWDEAELMESDKVHCHSKWYFSKDKGFRS